MKDLVSIIIPVYNSEKYIKENLMSIVRQSYSNIEVLAVDDGSKDSSSDVIKAMAKDYPIIKYIYQQNQGAPSARNNGLSKASGNCIYFVDSDDKLSEHAVDKMIQAFDDPSVDIVVGQYQHMNQDGEFKEIEAFGFKENQSFDVKKNIETLAFIPPFPGNKMYRKELLDINAVKFVDVNIAQDLNFFIKALALSEKVAFVKEVVYYYREVEGSISNTYSDSILDIKKSIDDIEEYYQAQGLIHPDLILNIRYLYYSYQLTKVPQIKNKKMRKHVFSVLKKDLKSIPKEKLYPEIYKKKYWNSTLKMKLSPLFLSDSYQKFQQSKKK